MQNAGLARLLITCFSLFFFLCSASFGAPQNFTFGSSTLSVPIPDNWVKGFEDKNNLGSLLEFVPKGQTVQKWENMITIQNFTRLGRFGPEVFLKNLLTTSRDTCEDYRGDLYTPEKPKQQKYPTAMAMQFCTKYSKTGKGEITLFKAIQTPNGLMVIQRAWRGEPFKLTNVPIDEATRKQWLRFMEQVKVTKK